MPLSPIEKMYQSILLTSAATSDSNDHLVSSIHTYSQSPWFGSWDYDDPLNERFLTDEGILEVMYLEETPWNDGHHRSSFLSSLCEIATGLENRVSPESTGPHQNPISVHEFLFEGRMGNISTTILIDIYVRLGIVENIHVGASCSLDEIKFYTTLFK